MGTRRRPSRPYAGRAPRPVRRVLAASAAGLVAALAALAALASCTTLLDDRGTGPTGGPALDSPAAPSPGPAPSDAGVRQLLTGARVVARQPDVPGYERGCGPGEGCVFGTEWTDDSGAPDGHNGCDTRNDVLGSSLLDVAFAPGSHDCDVVAGLLLDPYTGTAMDYASQGSQIHVDHLFPLAAAWDLGAADWSVRRRTRFANDTALELLAVQGTANLQKGDSTPASWLPPRTAYRCAYVTSYLEVALAYDLAITATDVAVIKAVARRSC